MSLGLGLATLLTLMGSACSADDADDTTAICTPQERTCQGDLVVTCSPAGTEWLTSEHCAHGCTGGFCGEAPCAPDCDGKICGDDGCGTSCGSCTGTQEACVAGACVCQPACDDKDCGDDGCGSTCGECDLTSTYCGAQGTCESCETAVCGVCDEIDVSQIVSYAGQIGGDHAINELRAEVFTWPITTDLEIDLSGPSPCFILHHFDGQSWQDTSNGYSDGAAMVACWHSISHGGVICQSYEWYSPDWNICRSMDWPVDRPVAHVLISAIDEKRTAIKYFESWPYNDVPPEFNAADVGTELDERPCL